jgi:hypothetical protein
MQQLFMACHECAHERVCIGLFIYVFIYLFIYLYIYLFIYLFMYDPRLCVYNLNIKYVKGN